MIKCEGGNEYLKGNTIRETDEWTNTNWKNMRYRDYKKGKYRVGRVRDRELAKKQAIAVVDVAKEPEDPYEVQL